MMNKPLLSIVLAIAMLAAAHGQDSIVYQPALASLYGWILTPVAVDLDQDGRNDFVLYAHSVIDPPIIGLPPVATGRVLATSLGANDYLMNTNGQILLNQADAVFGPETEGDQMWARTGSAGQLVSHGFADAWSGFNGSPLQCFLGVRFISREEWHYGWIRLLVPTLQEASPGPLVFPVLADWAFETRPNTRIRAGDVGANDEPVWVTVDFLNSDGTLHSGWNRRSTGAGVLSGSTFQYAFSLAGDSETASILGPAQPHSRAKATWELPPASHSFGVCWPDDLAPPHPEQPAVNCMWLSSEFFGEVPVSQAQGIHLRRGACYVAVEEGELFGQLVPVDPAARR